MSVGSYQWSANDARTNLLHAETQISRKVKTFWSGFTSFVLRDNVLEVAVGLMLSRFCKFFCTALVKGIVESLQLLRLLSTLWCRTSFFLQFRCFRSCLETWKKSFGCSDGDFILGTIQGSKLSTTVLSY